MILALLLLLTQQRVGTQPCACGPADLSGVNGQAIEAHERRSLDEASALYSRILKAGAPSGPTPEQKRLARRFAPRIYTTPTEPFPLKDFAVIMHPTEPLIAYHFFWEDDIDFPDDNDPCDHELMWVRYDPASGKVTGYATYFHGRILVAPPEAVEDANRHGGRPRVFSQWGKHGSMPPGWEKLQIVADAGDVERAYYPNRLISLEQYQRGTYQKLSTVGRQEQDSPLSRGWPAKFSGSWQDFVNFSRLVDPLKWLDRTGYIKVSCWNNAVIDRHFLLYNFRPKTEWWCP